MLKVDLYIDGTKVDLYEDENISITDTIQNIRDISKLFTSFTQDFSVPASKTNNKIFKHYYNPDIDGGFDARYSKTAEIKINGADYKKGSIKLNEVKLKSNKASSYSIRFYGDGIDLRDSLNENLLSYLNMEAYNHTYDGDTVRDGLESGLAGTPMARSATGSIIYPLISHTKRYAYDSTATPSFYAVEEPTKRLEYNQLKPAIKLIHIIEAIEADFMDSDGNNLSFTRDFFGEDEFQDLYMWLNKHEGVIQGADDKWTEVFSDDYTYDATKSSAGYTPNHADIAYYQDTTKVGILLSRGRGLPIYADSSSVSWDVEFDITTGGSGNYDITILWFKDNGGVGHYYLEQDIAAGSKNITYTIDSSLLSYGDQQKMLPRVYIQSEGTVTTIDIDMTLGRDYYIDSSLDNTQTGVYDITQITAVQEIIVSRQMPNQKIMDFLMGIFKMFNLVAYKQDDGDIYVDTMDNFYALGTDRDITKYVDITTSTVTPSILFDTVEFKYDDTETKLIAERESELGDVFGGLSYSLGNVFGNSTYTVDVPFSHLMFERLEEQGTGADADLLFGWYVDSSDNPTTGEPLIIYRHSTQSIDDNSDIEWEYDSGAVVSTAFQRTGNTNYITSAPTQTINFNAEFDEWDKQTVLENSLFANYYENYITSVYGSNVRIVTVEAYLPAGFILNYSMNDKLIIHGKKHKINSISIDLLDGKSTLELITE